VCVCVLCVCVKTKEAYWPNVRCTVVMVSLCL
jgi:hypothetical protein